jgi:hypothetical protein
MSALSIPDAAWTRDYPGIDTGPSDDSGLTSTALAESHSRWERARLRLKTIAQGGERDFRASAEAIRVTGVLIDRMSSDSRNEPPSRITVSPDGEIIVEWQDGGIYKEIEIDDAGRAELMEYHGGGKARFRDISVSTTRGNGNGISTLTEELFTEELPSTDQLAR